MKNMKSEKGQVALETIIVFVPWFIIVIMFFNLAFYLGSVMLAQATINRLALEAGAIGCLPDSVKQKALDDQGIGMRELTIKASSPERGLVVSPNPVSAECSPVEAGGTINGPFINGNRYIRVTAEYQQSLLFFGEQSVTRQAEAISQRREEVVR